MIDDLLKMAEKVNPDVSDPFFAEAAKPITDFCEKVTKSMDTAKKMDRVTLLAAGLLAAGETNVEALNRALVLEQRLRAEVERGGHC